jgi:hypothetical protein
MTKKNPFELGVLNSDNLKPFKEGNPEIPMEEMFPRPSKRSKIEKVTKYRTSDGEVFDNYHTAQHHESNVRRVKDITEFVDEMNRDHDLFQSKSPLEIKEELIKFLIDYAQELKRIL